METVARAMATAMRRAGARATRGMAMVKEGKVEGGKQDGDGDYGGKQLRR
jgi:hypothetical protein